MTSRLRHTSLTSSIVPGAPYACYPRDLDSRRRTRIYPDRGLLLMGGDGYAIRRVAEPCWHRSPQASSAVSSGHVSHGETGLARACIWRVGTHPVYQILSASDCCGQACSLL